MGGLFSSQTPPPPPSPTFSSPWRTIEWNKTTQMVDNLKQFQLNDQDMGHLRILLHGPISSGKSSFINSINNVFQGRITSIALVATSSISITKTYKTHYIKDGSSRLPFAFNDVMGLEPGDESGIHPDDVINALKGHLTEGYKFNPRSPLTQVESGYNGNPQLSDKVHCLVSVVSADSISRMQENVMNRMKTIRRAASDLGIPQVVVMTMPDKACKLVDGNLRNIYTSKMIKQMMDTCSNELGVPLDCILPVKNYSGGGLENDMNVLLMNAMTQIVNFANDYIWDLQQS